MQGLAQGYQVKLISILVLFNSPCSEDEAHKYHFL